MDKATILSMLSDKGNSILTEQSAEQIAFCRADDQQVHCSSSKAWWTSHPTISIQSHSKSSTILCLVTWAFPKELLYWVP